MRFIFKRLGIFMFCIFTMVNMTYGQSKSIIQMIDQDASMRDDVQPVVYSVDGQDNFDWIEYMMLCKCVDSDDRYECVIKFKEREYKDGDFWLFSLKNIKDEKENTIADLSNLSVDMNNWAFLDSKAFGSYNYDKNTGIETLTIHYHFYQKESIYVISWKNLEKDKSGK